MYARSYWILPFAAVLLASQGCTSDGGSLRPRPTTATTVDRSSPRAVLESLRRSYTDRSAADYESLLALDFEFHFCEQDARLGGFLTREEEVAIHRKMFDPARVETLELSFETGESAVDEVKADPLDPAQSLWTVTITGVDLLLAGWRETGEPFGARLVNGVERFWFRREDRVDPATGAPVWTIVEWREVCDEVP